MITLDVLHEGNHCLAVTKPTGLLTQGIPTLEAAGRASLKEKDPNPATFPSASRTGSTGT